METPQQQEQVRVADLEISDPAFFRDLLKAVSKVNEEPRVTVDPEGITVKQMSPDHKTMVDLYIPREHFWAYNVYEERTISFNAADLLRLVFKRGKMKDTTILMRIEADRIVCEIKRGGGRVRKVLPLLEPLEDETPEPKISFKSSVKILTGALIRAIEDCKTIEENDKVLIAFEPEQITFSAINGDDYGVENTYNEYADEILNYLTGETQKAYYTIEHILTLVKALKPITEAITLEISTDTPIRITAEFPIIGGHLIYYLASCVDFSKKEPEPHEDQEVEPAAPEVGPVEADPHEETIEAPEVEEIPPEEGIDIYQALQDLGFFAYSGEDGDLYRKNGLKGWRVQVYWGALVRIQQKGVYFPDKWATIRKFGIRQPDDTLIPEHEEALEAVKELIEKGTLDPQEDEPLYEDYPTGVEDQAVAEADALERAEAGEVPKYYYCEHCGHEIPEGEEVRLEDGDTILCETCAAPLEPLEEQPEVEPQEEKEEEPSAYEQYMRYYREALARHSAEGS